MFDLKTIVRDHRVAISIGIICVLAALGFIALDRLLHEVHLHDIRTALTALGPRHIMLAVAFTAVSYIALTFYDVLALHSIGQPLPYRTAALASFTSYTLSHNLGLSLLTGGSARYRVYSAAGLSVADVARVVTIASFTFWGGVITLAGAALTLHPQSMDIDGVGIGSGPLQATGILLLVAVVGLLLWSGPRGHLLKIGSWSIPLPGIGLALTQIGVAAIDLAAASAALFILVPGVDPSLWPAFFIGYTLAIIAVLVTHVPGGIGVFEAVVLAALPSANRPELIAALLVYRLIYYIAPLLLSVTIVTFQEGRRWRAPVANALGDVQTVASGLAPTMIAALVFLGGCVLLVSGSLPAMAHRTVELVALLPLPFIEASHMAASIAGAALLLLSSGLYRRLDGAFWLTRMILLAGAAFSLMKGLDYEEASVMLVIAGLLQWTRPAFYRRTSFTADALSAGWLATVAVAVAVSLSIWIGFFSYKHVAYSNDLWWHFAEGGNASRFLRASFAVAVLLLGTAIWRMLRPAAVAPTAAMSEIPEPRALALSSRTDANLALTGDKRFIVSASGDCFLMYQIRGHSWIVMSDPIGARQEWTDLLWQLREQADAAQGRLLLYQISAEALPAVVDLGLQIVKYGEEALVDLTRFSLEGPAAKSLRYAERRATREGAIFEIVPAEGVPAIIEAIHGISDRWLKAKAHREKGFSVGWFDPAYVVRFDCALVRHEGQIVAFANIWKTVDKSELSIDLMRHDDRMPYGTMDFLFVRLMEWGKDEGYRRFSLGMAPLSGLEARRLAPLWTKLGSLLYKHGEALYGFEGLRAYKDKFSPNWQPRFIAGPHGLALGRAMIDLQALISARKG